MTDQAPACGCWPDGVCDVGGCWSIVDAVPTADSVGLLNLSDQAGGNFFTPSIPKQALFVMLIPVDVAHRIAAAAAGVARQTTGPIFRPSADGRTIVIPWSVPSVRLSTTVFGVANAGYRMFWR